MKRKKSQGGGQGRCERRSEAFVKIQKKKKFGGGGGGSRVEGGQGGCELRSEAFVKIKKKYFFFLGGGESGWGCRVGGDRVDVNGEVKLL